jgi:hypothetical protein
VFATLTSVLVAITWSPSSADEPARDDFVVLFDGKSLVGWQASGDASWQVVNGTIRTSGDQQGFLMTADEYGDFDLHVEFKAPATTNSGVFFRTSFKPTDPTKDCYELNIAPEDNQFPTGSLVARKKSDIPAGSDRGRPGDAISILNPWDGRWHALEVVATGDKITVRLDDRAILRYEDQEPIHRGRIGLQANQGSVAFRNIRIRETGGD